MRTLLTTAAAALVLAACASNPEPVATPAAAMNVDPVGTYTFNTAVQGMAVTGQARIGGTEGRWSGSLYTDVTGELPITSVAVSGRQITLLADTPDGTVRIRMMMDGDSFTGDWALGAEGGTLRGQKVAR